MKLKIKTISQKKFLSVLVIVALSLTFFTPQSAYAGTTLLFTTEDPDGINSDAYTLDKDAGATNILLNFASTSNQLKYDTTGTQFVFNQALNLSGKQLKNFRIENASAGATCDANAKGQIFYDTDDNSLYYCNGTTYVSTAGSIADDSITGTKLADAVAGAGLVKDGSENLSVNVDGTTIEINTDALRIKAGGVGSNEIGADAIGTSELADNAVDSGAIASGAVTAGKIGTGGVSNANQFGAGVVDATAIGTGAVDADEIVANAVGNSEMADSAVGSAEISDNSIALGDIAERNATVAIVPIYPDYSFNPDGTNNVGTMESGTDTANNKNFYSWYTKNTGTAQDYDIVVQWHIPENFTGWQPSNQIQVDYKTDTTTATDNQIDLTLKDSAGSAASLTGGAALVSGTADTWVTNGNVTFTGGTWSAGSILTLTIKLSSQATSSVNFNPAYIGQIKFNIKVK